MDTSDIRSLPFLWHRGPDFIKDGSSKVPLIFRMATVADKKGAAPAHPPRYLWLRSGQKVCCPWGALNEVISGMLSRDPRVLQTTNSSSFGNCLS